MSWLLFLDESGHDHKNTPYEVRGGFAIHTKKLWAFIREVQRLELLLFGTHLNRYKSEIKGSKLLAKDRFKWAKQSDQMSYEELRKHSLNFLNSSAQKRTPRKHEFTSYGQSCLKMAEEIILLLRSYDAHIFASFIPKVKRPDCAPAEFLRKDHVYLFERFHYFLKEKKETGLIIMDGCEKELDKQFVRRMEKYFTETLKGKERTEWIIPSPFFVESDMSYGIQVADLCIYCLNWGARFTSLMTEDVREEIRDYYWVMESLIWHSVGIYENQHIYSTVYVPNPYGASI